MNLNQTLNANQLFAKNLKARVKELGLTQKQFADMIGITQQSVNPLLNGKHNPTLPRAEFLANKVGRTLQELLEDHEANSRKLREMLQK